MYLSRIEKERIALAIGVLVLLPGLFFGGRAVLNAFASSPASTAPVEEPVQPPPGDPAVVTYLEGDADGRRGSSGQWDRLAAGDELDRLSVIRTYPASYLDLRLQTGTVVRVIWLS